VLSKPPLTCLSPILALNIASLMRYSVLFSIPPVLSTNGLCQFCYTRCAKRAIPIHSNLIQCSASAPLELLNESPPAPIPGGERISPLAIFASASASKLFKHPLLSKYTGLVHEDLTATYSRDIQKWLLVAPLIGVLTGLITAAITILILQVIWAALFPYYLAHHWAILVGLVSGFFVTGVIMHEAGRPIRHDGARCDATKRHLRASHLKPSRIRRQHSGTSPPHNFPGLPGRQGDRHDCSFRLRHHPTRKMGHYNSRRAN
jgi:hypothetical protein